MLTLQHIHIYIYVYMCVYASPTVNKCRQNPVYKVLVFVEGAQDAGRARC